MSNIISSSDIMLKVANFNTGDDKKEISSVWKNVVQKIKSYQKDDDYEISLGEKLAANSNVVDFKNGVLLVETNHSGWIQYLNFYKKFIMKGIKIAIPEIKISSLAFRVAGSEVSLSESYEKSLEYNKKLMEKKIDDQEKAQLKYAKNSKIDDEEKVEVPLELAEKFESLINGLLTKTES